jgi:hypothetical protein
MSEPEKTKEPKKRYKDMTSKERFDKMVADGVDPFDRDRAHCHDCGYFPAFVPRVMVANLEKGTTDRYLLQLPHLCDTCTAKKGLTRYGFLVPKTREMMGPTEMMTEHLERLPEWVKRVQEATIQDAVKNWNVSEEEAKAMLGYT